MWEFVPGWPVPHLVLDYAAAILDFVNCFVIFVKNLDFGGFRRIWRDLARCGEIWEVVPGWPVPHPEWDYAAAILDFVQFFVISVKNVRKCMFDRFSIDFR